jgi:hypothetical protein
MKQHIVAALAAVVISSGLIASAPPASAGCLYGWVAKSRCDGPVQPDGTWQRCVEFQDSFSSDSHLRPGGHRCDVLGPDLHPWGLAFSDPPTHIDDSAENPS